MAFGVTLHSFAAKGLELHPCRQFTVLVLDAQAIGAADRGRVRKPFKGVVAGTAGLRVFAAGDGVQACVEQIQIQVIAGLPPGPLPSELDGEFLP